jgi:hypothetical protein
VYLYYGALPAYRYYAPRYGLVYIKAIEGVSSRGNAAAYYKQLDALRHRGRFWFVFSHPFGKEQELMVKYCDSFAKRVRSCVTTGALCILYDTDKGVTAP